MPYFTPSTSLSFAAALGIEYVTKSITYDVDADGNPDVDEAWKAFGEQADALTEYETTAAESETTVEINDGDSFEG